MPDVDPGKVPPFACHRQDVVEFSLLLTSGQADALSRASARRGMTFAQLVRQVLGDFIRNASRLPINGTVANAGGALPPDLRGQL